MHHGDENLTREMYRENKLNARGWATASEIQVAAVLLQCQINVWLQGRRLMSPADSYTLLPFNPLVQSVDCNSNRPMVINLLLHNDHF